MCERKTTVALLAIVKCLQGHIVDGWTSSPILTEEDVDGTRIRVQTYSNYKQLVHRWVQPHRNILRNRRAARYDWKLSIRDKRPFDIVILDEIELMFINNDGHFPKLLLIPKWRAFGIYICTSKFGRIWTKPETNTWKKHNEIYRTSSTNTAIVINEVSALFWIQKGQTRERNADFERKD